MDPLSVIKTPQVQKLCNNFECDFPTWEIYFNKHSAESIKAFRNSLEHVIERLKRTVEILKGLLASMNQKLVEVSIYFANLFFLQKCFLQNDCPILKLFNSKSIFFNV